MLYPKKFYKVGSTLGALAAGVAGDITGPYTEDVAMSLSKPAYKPFKDLIEYSLDHPEDAYSYTHIINKKFDFPKNSLKALRKELGVPQDIPVVTNLEKSHVFKKTISPEQKQEAITSMKNRAYFTPESNYIKQHIHLPRGNNDLFTAAHELSHASTPMKQNKFLKPISPFLEVLYNLSANPGDYVLNRNILSALDGYNRTVAKIKGKPLSSAKKLLTVASLAPITVHLTEEAQASLRGYNALKKLNLPKEQLDAAKQWYLATYLTHATNALGGQLGSNIVGRITGKYLH